jgi:iron complex outermembrane receptor protein
MRNRYYIALLFVLYYTVGHSQVADSLLQTVADSVLVSASRLPSLPERVPYAVSRIGKKELQEGRQQWSLAEPLRRLPGLLILNDNNYSQDLRLSVRGFGARAAFGIRGIRITVDGFPESTPDGQGQVDNIDPGILEDASLLRGPASSLHGNAAGGVLQLQTESPPDSLLLWGRFSAGSFGFQRYQLKAGGQAGDYGWLVYGSHTRADGFREHSRMEASLFNGKLQRELAGGGQLSLLLNLVHSPIAQDPGGIDQATAEENPTVAWERNLSFDAQESVTQGRIGLKWEQPLAPGQSLQATAFYLRRDFENRLPFEGGGAVQLDREFYGGSFQYTGRFKLWQQPYRLAMGATLERQEDLRQRFDNLQGELGDLVFDQLELFTALGAYAVQEWTLLDQFWVNGALRYDFNELEARDFYTVDGENSGLRSYHTLSPSVGVSYAYWQDHVLYANYSYSFETPALSELSANAGGIGGFNPDLQPQRAYNYELGSKGRFAPALRYSLAAYFIQLRGELLPFEEAGQAGRFLFRNAGRSARIGVEADMTWAVANRWELFLRYNYARFTYQDYELEGADYEGNRLPGIPAHNALGELSFQYHENGAIQLRGRYLSQIWADDANTVASDAFLVLAVQASQQWKWKATRLKLFGGVQNLMDTRYNQNVRINAFGGRYFEPAPGRTLYIGCAVQWQ